ncbi:MAG: 2-isopropylmalate synthase [Zoogloeaceae bacterium]|nr:2-isopropylmalate synthase [Zoogloeaceae bacterium]
MLQDVASKYPPFPTMPLADRQWPNRRITRAPIWMSTDLRDGNQALFEPMPGEKKLAFFQSLCRLGFKEIEVAFPSASETEFQFVRTLIETNLIPEDVRIEVLAPARPELIRRTFAALSGARDAIVHIYNATSAQFREIVFGMEREAVKALAVDATRLCRELAEQGNTKITLEYSPETFSATEPEFALEVCDAVTEAWGATPENRVILNLPGSVEVATPNVYADQIEWMHRRLARRESVILSVHPHNDRGTAVAAAELALMAGADRVEGCLFGNGERTGNVDLVTLALNLYTQGIHPGLDFSDLGAVARMAEEYTRIAVHPRHPYAGDLVFTAFSGSHQDAIRKGLAARQASGAIRWNIPYLPIDPADIGRGYDSIIRVNSQSGKGGVAHLMETHYGIVMPRRLQVEFSRVVQRHAEASGGELEAGTLWQLFSTTYLEADAPLQYRSHHRLDAGNDEGIELEIVLAGETRRLAGTGNGPIDATLAALRQAGIMLEIRSFEERALGSGGNARAVAFVEVARSGATGTCYGVGIDENIVTASLRALLSAANRLMAREREPDSKNQGRG